MTPRAATAQAKERSSTCPKCGGALDFRSDSMGYGQTIEQCENPRCDHWTVLETIRRPAHARTPHGGERPQIPRKIAYRGELQAAILAALPATEAGAVRAKPFAVTIGRDVHTVEVRLRQLAAAGVVASRKLGPHRLSPRVYWRAA